MSELASMLGIRPPSLSQQLGVLRDKTVVTTRRDGKQVYYSLGSPEAAAVLQELYALFCAKTPGGSDGK